MAKALGKETLRSAYDAMIFIIVYAIVSLVITQFSGITITEVLLILLAVGIFSLIVVRFGVNSLLRNQLDSLPFFSEPMVANDMVNETKKLMYILGGTLDHFHDATREGNAREKVLNAAKKGISFEFVLLDKNNPYIEKFVEAGLYTADVTRSALETDLRELQEMRDEIDKLKRQSEGHDNRYGSLKVKTTMLPITYHLSIKDPSDKKDGEIHVTHWNFSTRHGFRPVFVIRAKVHPEAFQKYIDIYGEVTGDIKRTKDA